MQRVLVWVGLLLLLALCSSCRSKISSIPDFVGIDAQHSSPNGGDPQDPFPWDDSDVVNIQSVTLQPSGQLVKGDSATLVIEWESTASSVSYQVETGFGSTQVSGETDTSPFSIQFSLSSIGDYRWRVHLSACGSGYGVEEFGDYVVRKASSTNSY